MTTQINEQKQPDKSAKIVPSNSTDLLSAFPLMARYKNRKPDPGICTVTQINWHDNGLSMISGGCEYFPAFSEIKIVSSQQEQPYCQDKELHLLQIFQVENGIPLHLGMKIKVNRLNKYYSEWTDEYIVTGIDRDHRDGSLNVTIADSWNDAGADGWSPLDLIPSR